VLTTEGYKKAKDIKSGDTLITVSFDDLPLGDPNCSIGNVTDECIDIVDKWNSSGLHKVNFIESNVTDIKEATYESSIYFNDDISKELSLSEQILVNRDEKFTFKTTSEIKVGDIIISYLDKDLIDIEVKSINIVEKETKAFLFYREPYGLIIADGMLAYNGCPSASIDA
jgi:hypothetical protein